MGKSELSICIYEHAGGCYFNAAQLLSPYFKNTYYFSEWKNAFPHPALASIGTGYEKQNIFRVDDFWMNLDKFDIIIFMDGGMQDISNYLRSIGKMVFGGSNIYNIEQSRSLFHQCLETANLPVANTKKCNGLQELIKFVKTKKDKWIKISKWRGLEETYHWIDWNSSKFWLDQLTAKLGPLAYSSKIEFIVEDPIESIAELGGDYIFSKGQLPMKNQVVGIEAKDVGYCGRVFPIGAVPKCITDVNYRFSPFLSTYGNDGFYSTEIRITEDGTPFYVDICARCPSPPGSSILFNISNFDELIPAICKKQDWIEPKYKSTYMVEIILKSNYVKNGYLNVNFPPEIEQNITFKGAMKDSDGKVWIIPFNLSNMDMVEFGSVIVNDDNLDTAIQKALDICSQIQAFELRYELSATDVIKQQLSELKENIGFEF